MPMKTFIDSGEMEWEQTGHGTGLKKVLLQATDTPTMLTQLAYGKLLPGDTVPMHSHNSMEEIFYFLKGEGTYTLNDTALQVSPSTVVRIAAGVQHSLAATGLTTLEFLYFGIATG